MSKGSGFTGRAHSKRKNKGRHYTREKTAASVKTETGVINSGIVNFVAPKIDDTNPRCFAMTEQEKRLFYLNEVDVEFFPFNANNGIYLMRTKVKGTKGREDTFRVRIVIVDIYRCSDFERRNDENDKGEIKKTILISTETDFSPSILLDFVPEKFVDSMMKDYLAQESELIETSKKIFP